MRKCKRCKEAPAMKHTDVCGICEVLAVPQEQRSRVNLFGAQTNDLVPSHFNMGLGKQIDGYDDLKKQVKIAHQRGTIVERTV